MGRKKQRSVPSAYVTKTRAARERQGRVEKRGRREQRRNLETLQEIAKRAVKQDAGRKHVLAQRVASRKDSGSNKLIR